MVPPAWTQGAPVPDAIGATITADLMIVEPAAERDGGYSHLVYAGRGPREQLIGTARRAAWASLAFALRSRAAVRVDVKATRA
jgi:hypothetical protein